MSEGVGLFVKTVDDAPDELVVGALRNVVPTQWPFDDVLVFDDRFPNNDLWIVDPSSDSAVATLPGRGG